MIARAPVVSERAGRGAARVVAMLPPLTSVNDLADRDLPEQVAEEDEEEQRPEERDEAVGVLLEGRAEDLDAQELQDRLEEVPRAGGASPRASRKSRGNDHAASAAPPTSAMNIWLVNTNQWPMRNQGWATTCSVGSAAARNSWSMSRFSVCERFPRRRRRSIDVEGVAGAAVEGPTVERRPRDGTAEHPNHGDDHEHQRNPIESHQEQHERSAVLDDVERVDRGPQRDRQRR